VAFGTIVQSWAVHQQSDFEWGTDASTPTSGNLIVVAIGDRANGSYTPSGYTELYLLDPWANSGSTRTGIYAKIAAASESDISMGTNYVRWLVGVEVEGPFESLSGLAILDANTDNESTGILASTGIATGSTGTLDQADNLAFLVVSYRAGTANDDTPTALHTSTDNFTERE